MKYFNYILITAVLFVAKANAQSIIPTPKSMKTLQGEFLLKNGYNIKFDKDLTFEVAFLSNHINDATQLTSVSNKDKTFQISLNLVSLPKLSSEGYHLTIDKQGVHISANSKAGILYGVTSLIQLVYGYKDFGVIKLPYLSITDDAKYEWRSFMLDSGRQFHTLDFIKKYLNHMALLKMNVFHWHLTENDGWRIAIKKYPKLTEIGGFVANGNEQQGFYSQEDIKEIVAYAANLNIQVVPEIDLPGHSDAAVTAYPEISCLEQIPDKTKYKFHSPYIFCAGKESTYTFIENVIDEVVSLFPSEYIHLGGDEAAKDHWKKCPSCQKKIKDFKLGDEEHLQLYFSNRLANYARSKGKKVIFWNDVLIDENATLPDNCVVQWWNYRTNGTQGIDWAIKSQIPVIVSPSHYTYIWFPITPWAKCRENRTFDLRMVYENNNGDFKNPHPLIMGMSVSLWGDFNGQQYMADRKVFPRIYALSEQMWSLAERSPFEMFYTKVKDKYKMLDHMNVDYSPALREDVPSGYRWE